MSARAFSNIPGVIYPEEQPRARRKGEHLQTEMLARVAATAQADGITAAMFIHQVASATVYRACQVSGVKPRKHSYCPKGRAIRKVRDFMDLLGVSIEDLQKTE